MATTFGALLYTRSSRFQSHQALRTSRSSYLHLYLSCFAAVAGLDPSPRCRLTAVIVDQSFLHLRSVPASGAPVILALLGSSVAPAAVVWTVLEVAFDVDGPFEEWQLLLLAVLVEEVLVSLLEALEPEVLVVEVIPEARRGVHVEPAARSFAHPLEC